MLIPCDGDIDCTCGATGCPDVCDAHNHKRFEIQVGAAGLLEAMNTSIFQGIEPQWRPQPYKSTLTNAQQAKRKKKNKAAKAARKRKL